MWPEHRHRIRASQVESEIQMLHDRELNDKARKLNDEEGRVAALKRLNVLDTPAEERFDKITRLVSRVLETPAAAVTLIDEHRQWFKSSQGVPVPEMPREISFCTHAIRSAEPTVIPDARLDSRLRTNPAVISGQAVSYAGAPLSTPDGYLIGTLCVFDIERRDFTPAQVDLLSGFAGIAMEQLQLRQLTHRDYLTGTLTRRGFFARAEGEIAEARPGDKPGAIILFDIDHFKSINDRFGHGTGDDVLRSLSELCGSAMPENAFLGRIGGEEFAILLPRASERDAAEVAEQLRAGIEHTPMSDQQLQVTASFGIAELDGSITSADEWLCAADAPLYEAKRNGRNQCRTAGAASALSSMAGERGLPAELASG